MKHLRFTCLPLSLISLEGSFIISWDMASSQSATLGYLQTAKIKLHGGSTCATTQDILAGALSAVNLGPIVLLSKLLVHDRASVKPCSLGKMAHPKLLAGKPFPGY